MIQTKEYHARYFNGKSAIPEIGIALLQQTTLIFYTDTQNHKFSIDSFFRLVPIPSGIRCILNADEEKESPTIEITCISEEAKQIEQLWLLNKKGENLFQSIGFFFQKLHPITIISISLLFLAFCGGIYFFALQRLYLFIPVTLDSALGERFKQNIESGFPVCKSKELDHFFAKALKEILPKDSRFKYTIQVINLPDQNAISLAGGRIYFFSGLLNASESQEEILGVLAHEISHVEKRHHLRSITKALGTSLAISLLVGPGLGDFQTLETLTEIGSTIAVLKFSRDFESEADEYALELLRRSNRSAEGLLTFLRRIEKEEKGIFKNSTENQRQTKESPSVIDQNILSLLSTHPLTSDRVEKLKTLSKAFQSRPSKLLVSEKEWKKLKFSCASTPN